MQEKMLLAEQIQNVILLNYGGTVDNQFMKAINAISSDIAQMEAYNSEMLQCISDLMNYMDMTEVIYKKDHVYQNLVNAVESN